MDGEGHYTPGSKHRDSMHCRYEDRGDQAASDEETCCAVSKVEFFRSA